MIINSAEFQNNVGKYLDLANNQEIVIMRNGHPVARLLGMDKTLSFLTDQLVGILPESFDTDSIKEERLARQ